MRAQFWAVFILAAMTMVAVKTSGESQSADQFLELARQAKNAGDLLGEANYLCQAAAINEKKYGKKCDRARNNANNAIAQFQADMEMARTELQHKDYPGAMRDFGKITFGPNKAEAQRLMQQIREGAIITPEMEKSQSTLKAAHTAYVQGDFDSAVNLAKQVQAPVLQPIVNQLLANINIYRDSMKEAEILEHNGDFKGAEQKYQFATTIRANGPGEPQRRLQAVLDEEAKAASAQPLKQPPPQERIAKATITHKPEVRSKAEHAAKLDGFLSAAHQAEDNGDRKQALSMYNAALKLDARQADALAGRIRVLEAIQYDLKSAQAFLESGIRAFYGSRLDEARGSLHKYLRINPSQYAGVAHFYLGASFLTEAIFNSPREQTGSDDLWGQAQQEFAQARLLHYRPVKTAVSPEILAQWSQIGGR